MSNWIIGLFALLAASFWLWPFLRGEPELESIRWPLAYGLSIGGMTLIMAIIGLLPGQWLNAIAVWGLVAAATAVGGLPLFRSVRLSKLPRPGDVWQSLRSGSLRHWTILSLTGVFFIILAFATYYPFIGEDEIIRYAFFAKRIWLDQSLQSGARGYPMLMSLAYALTFFASGAIFDQLAKLTPVLFALMTLLATFALAARWGGKGRAGWIAAVTLAATPLFVNWSPFGYVDIPAALYLVLSAYAADVWLEKRGWHWAALAGALAGLGLWTKQSDFVALLALGFVFAFAIVRDWLKANRRGAWRAILAGLVALGSAFAAGGWWYVRNAIYDGWQNAVPGPGQFYEGLAAPNWANAVPFVGHLPDFGYVTGLLYTVGFVVMLIRLFRRKPPAGYAWLLVWSIPYFILWFLYFAYDTRFLLTVLPFFAVLVGMELSKLKIEINHSAFRRAMIAGMAAVCALGTVGRLGGVYHWVVNPLKTNEQRLAYAKPDLAETVAFLQDHTETSAEVIVMDGRLLYYFMDRPYTESYPQTAAAAKEADYVVVRATAQYAIFPRLWPFSDLFAALQDPAQFAQVFVSNTGNLIVYRVVK
ncbi:MAG: glycosyltransferase family 39 protein [Chloroflexota bacterium]